MAISEATRDELFQFVPGLEAKTRVIYQSAGAWARTLPSRTTEPAGPPRLLYVGALTARKNVATVLEALRALPDVDWHFDIVGTGAEQPALAALAQHPALAGRVHLHGRVPDDVLAALRVVADLEPPVPPRVTRLAQGALTPSGEIVDPLEDGEATSGESIVGAVSANGHKPSA